MKEIGVNTMSIWLAISLMAGICGMALAQPDGEPNGIEPARGFAPLCRMGMNLQCEMMPPQNEGFPMGVPLEVLFSGHGQALKDNESHKLRLKIETIMPMQPRQIRDLLSSNKSLEEIRGDIRSKGEDGGQKAFRGSMILDRSMYPLINIAIIPDNGNSTITADLADIAQTPSDEPTALGSISLEVSPSGDKMIGEGELTVQEDGKQEIYSLILNMDKRRQMGKGRMAPPDPQ